MINRITQNPHYPKLLVFLQFGIIGLMLLFSDGLFSSIVGVIIFTIGAILGIWALQHNRVGNFNIQPNIKASSSLVTTGIYAYIRHPMYSSVILMLLGVLISSPTMLEFILFILLIVVLLLKAKREESLWVVHDQAYVTYQKNTKLFIPYVL